MSSPQATATEVTGLLQAWRLGDGEAGEALLRRVYGELKRIAASQLRGESVGNTLQPTALVHEAYLRLLGQQRIDWRDRAHFFGLAATMMRRVLVDHARARMAGKRRPEEEPVPITLAARSAPEVELLDLDRSLAAFARHYPRQARVVEMRYFADLSIEEIGSCLEVSPATVKRDWQFARAWLGAEIGGGGGQ
jgi:RNA polymerase sigma factor (TIGR02999 family)